MEQNQSPKLFDNQFELEQRRTVRRFKLSNVFSWILDGFSLDYGTLHTLKNLTLKPGAMVKSYLYEGRLNFTPPFRLLLVTTTLVILAFEYSSLSEGRLESFETASQGEESKQLVEQLGYYMQRYLNLVLWLVIPSFSLFSWLFNRNSGYNYAENLVLNTYYTAFVNILFTMFLAEDFLGTTALYIIYFTLSLGHYIICLKQMFSIDWIKAVGQTIAIMVLGTLLYGILLAVVFTIIVFSLK